MGERAFPLKEVPRHEDLMGKWVSPHVGFHEDLTFGNGPISQGPP